MTKMSVMMIESARTDVELVLDELHDREEQISEDPCHKEGDEHSAQILDKEDNGND